MFFEPENAGALAEAVVSLCDDPDRCRELGENGRRHVQQFFDRSKLAGFYLELLQQTVDGPPAEAVLEP